MNATSLEAIYRYDIPGKVPLHGEISFEDLAKKCNMYAPNLRRILRYGIVYHRVFQEPREGFISHSAASKALVDDSAVLDGLGLMFDGGWQSYSRVGLLIIEFWLGIKNGNKSYSILLADL